MRQTTSGMRSVPHSVLVLGFSGVLPFIVAALLAFAGPPSTGTALRSLLIYGAIVLSFMGGVHCGMAMARRQVSIGRLGINVVPALVAWPAALLGGATGFLALATAFAGLLVYDLETVRKGGAPAWYPALRWPLTLIVIACLLLGALAASFWAGSLPAR